MRSETDWESSSRPFFVPLEPPVHRIYDQLALGQVGWLDLLAGTSMLCELFAACFAVIFISHGKVFREYGLFLTNFS